MLKIIRLLILITLAVIIFLQGRTIKQMQDLDADILYMLDLETKNLDLVIDTMYDLHRVRSS